MTDPALAQQHVSHVPDLNQQEHGAQLRQRWVRCLLAWLVGYEPYQSPPTICIVSNSRCLLPQELLTTFSLGSTRLSFQCHKDIPRPGPSRRVFADCHPKGAPQIIYSKNRRGGHDQTMRTLIHFLLHQRGTIAASTSPPIGRLPTPRHAYDSLKCVWRPTTRYFDYSTN